MEKGVTKIIHPLVLLVMSFYTTHVMELLYHSHDEYSYADCDWNQIFNRINFRIADINLT